MSPFTTYNPNDLSTSAFTLAEVLIVLTIIGVLAAIVVPGLLQSSHDLELRVATKKAFSTLSNAYKLAASDNGGGFGAYTSSTTLSYTKFNAIKAKLNVIKECPYSSGSFGNCWAPGEVGSGTPSSCDSFSNNGQNKNYSIETADGMYIMLYTYSTTTGADIIAIDVNGAKGPNDWGKDVFYFKIGDTNLYIATTCDIKHNDGSDVNETSEFLYPFIN
jgi:prepilin-type N-terminal cleavage/methylation domain-containing protein